MESSFDERIARLKAKQGKVESRRRSIIPKQRRHTTTTPPRVESGPKWEHRRTTRIDRIPLKVLVRHIPIVYSNPAASSSTPHEPILTEEEFEQTPEAIEMERRGHEILRKLTSRPPTEERNDDFEFPLESEDSEIQRLLSRFFETDWY